MCMCVCRKCRAVTPSVMSTQKRPRGLENSRIQALDFVTPPPGPQRQGRPPSARIIDSNTVRVDKKRHCLIRTRHRGRCVCCYAAAPPLNQGECDVTPSSKRKTKMTDGSAIPQTLFKCNVCDVFLCKHCFFNTWSLHFRTGVKPLSVVYIN